MSRFGSSDKVPSLFSVTILFIGIGGMIVTYGQLSLADDLHPFALQRINGWKTFEDTKSYCQSRYSWLAEVKTDNVYEDLKALAGTSTFWIGGAYTATDGWRWLDGSPILWGEGSLTDLDSAQCLTFSASKNFSTRPCSFTAGVVCQFVKQSTFFYNEFEFRIPLEKFSSNGTAQNACVSWHENAHLVDIVDEGTDKQITAELNRRQQGTRFFTSGNDNALEGQWVWSDGSGFGNYRNWKSYRLLFQNEPNGIKNENCLMIYKKTDWKWYDFPCTPAESVKAICQRRIGSGSCSDDLCSKRGRCVVEAVTPGMNFSCRCNSPYVGRMCEIDPCRPNPCQNLGTCTPQTASPFFTCSCTFEYQGRFCQDRTFNEFDNCIYHINLMEKSTQTQASRVCSSIESSLAVLKNQSRRDYISHKIRYDFQKTDENFWIGGTKTGNQWTWLDGSAMSPLYPDGVDTSNTNYKCVTAVVGPTLEVTANQCSQPMGYICERPAQGSPCSSMPCLNDGSCKDVGCHYDCTCLTGYSGGNCQTDFIELHVLQNTMTVWKNKDAYITVDIKSLVGNVTVEIRSSLRTTSQTVAPGKHTFSLGLIETQLNTFVVTLTLRPLDLSFSRQEQVTFNVTDPPSVSFNKEWIAVPVDQNSRYVYCRASGIPPPTIAWYKDSEKVSESSSRKIYQRSQVLVLTNAAKHDVGVYTCRATNIVDGKTFVDEKRLYVIIRPRLLEKNISATDGGGTVMSCKFESFPLSNISWTYTPTDGKVSKKIKNGYGSMFNFNQRSYDNFHEGILNIELPEWLSEGEIRCIATSQFHMAEGVYYVNPRARAYNGQLYTFTNTNNRMTRTEAEEYCSAMGSEVCTVNDEDTNNELLRHSRMLQDTSSVHIGGRAFEENGSRIWRWKDGRMIYNESKYHKWKAEYNRILEGVFVAWHDGKPSNHRDKSCMIFHKQLSGQYSWSNVKCSLSCATICQKLIAGSPVIQHVGGGNCSSTISLSWSPSPAALSITHRIHVTPIEADHAKKPNPFDIIATKNVYHREFRNLSHSTRYRIRIYPCPGYCMEEGGVTRYFTTGDEIPEPNYKVNVSQVVETSTCVISWSDDHISKGIIGHTITAVSSLVRASSEVLMAYEDRVEVDLPTSNTVFEQNVLPNRNYSFIVRVKTCAGLGSPKVAQGKCVTDSAAPNHVPTPILFSGDEISESGMIKMTFPQVDETNGPVSCVFILVDTTNSQSLRNEDFSVNDLRSASYLKDRQAPSAIYISLALSAEDMANRISRNDTGNTLLIGDNTTSSCDARRVPTFANTRTKRASDPEQVFYGYNAPLSKANAYRIFAVSSTPTGEGTILFKAGTSEQLGTAQSPKEGTSVAWIAGVVVGLLVVICVVGLLVKRRNASTLEVKPESQPIELQEHQNGRIADSTSPVYENCAVNSGDLRAGTDIPLTKLEAIYIAMLLNGSEGFEKQYKELKDNTAKLKFPQEIGSDPQVTKKNRYKNILPYDKSIVKLSGGAPANYINASFIEGFSQGNKFIATQGPLPATVNDFWRMVTERKCHTIVMLTKCVESNKKKCAKYWPDVGQNGKYDKVDVKNELEEMKSGYIVRSFRVSYQGCTLSVQQIQYLNWPDHGVPVTTSDFFRLHRAVSLRMKSFGSNAPTIVHCSAGAGRTGAFISYDYLSEERQMLNHVDVYSCVFNLRRQRIQMVQNKDQYTLVHKLLLEDYLFGDTELSTSDFISKTRDLNEEVAFDKEFANLDKVEPMQSDKSESTPSSENGKGSVAPYIHSLLIMQQLPEEQNTPFFNASLVPTYHDSMIMIAAHGPSESSIDTFWRAVFDYDVSVMVMLTNCIEGNERQCAQYWPRDVGNVMTLGCMTVEMSKAYSLNEKTVAREFLLVREKTSKNVVQYQFKDWPAATCPSDTSLVLSLIATLKFATQQSHKPTILVHCSDGAGRTGAFCAILNLIDRLNNENVVDVFKTVKDLRDFRPRMVQNVGQYKFCYKAISDYLSASSVYSNFDMGTQESLYANL